MVTEAGQPGADGRDKKGSEGEDDEGLSPYAKMWFELAPYLETSWVFVAAISAFSALGFWLDLKLHTGRKLFIAGALLGIGVGFVNFFKVVLAMSGKRK